MNQSSWGRWVYPTRPRIIRRVRRQTHRSTLKRITTAQSSPLDSLCCLTGPSPGCMTPVLGYRPGRASGGPSKLPARLNSDRHRGRRAALRVFTTESAGRPEPTSELEFEHPSQGGHRPGSLAENTSQSPWRELSRDYALCRVHLESCSMMVSTVTLSVWDAGQNTPARCYAARLRKAQYQTVAI